MKSPLRAKSYALIAGTTLLLLSLSGSVFATRETHSFIWIAGGSSPALPVSDCKAIGFPTGVCTLCDIAVCPDVAMAGSGDKVTIAGSGSLTISTTGNSATGSGTFDDTASKDILGSGTWSAVSLIGFTSFGSASAQGLPSDLFGGKAAIRVSLSTGGTAVLVVTCLLGAAPAGLMEGVMLRAHNINFETSFSGNTIFVKTS